MALLQTPARKATPAERADMLRTAIRTLETRPGLDHKLRERGLASLRRAYRRAAAAAQRTGHSSRI